MRLAPVAVLLAGCTAPAAAPPLANSSEAAKAVARPRPEPIDDGVVNAGSALTRSCANNRGLTITVVDAVRSGRDLCASVASGLASMPNSPLLTSNAHVRLVLRALSQRTCSLSIKLITSNGVKNVSAIGQFRVGIDPSQAEQECIESMTRSLLLAIASSLPQGSAAGSSSSVPVAP